MSADKQSSEDEAATNMSRMDSHTWRGPMIMRKIALFILLAWRCPLLATTYYVDYLVGNDTAAGTTIGTAFRHCPGDTNASSVCAGTVLHAGDFVLFNSTNQYTVNSGIPLTWSGNPGSPITYDAYGSGRAVLTQQNNLLVTPYGFRGVAVSNLILNDFEICNVQVHSVASAACTNSSTFPFPAGIHIQGASAVTISNCFIHDIGDYTNAPNYSVAWMFGYGIEMWDYEWNITITNCEFTKIGKAGIYIDAGYNNAGAATNVYICGCLMHDFMPWGINLFSQKTNSILQDIYIDGFTWSNYWQYSPGEWVGCASAFPHTDGIMLEFGGLPLPTGMTLGTLAHPIVIRNSTFINNATNQNDLAGTTCIFMDPWGGVVEIYNNLFINVLNYGEGSIFADGDDGEVQPALDVRVFNNSFLDTNRNFFMAQGLTNKSPGDSVSLSNNVFYNYQSGGSSIAPIWIDGPTVSNATVMMDYDVCYDLGNPTGFFYIKTNGFGSAGWGTFAQAQSLGFETHGQFANPQYAAVNGPTPFLTNTSMNDLHLQSSSPAIKSGLNLLSFFRTDRTGHPRSLINQWAAGAYSYPSLWIQAQTGAALSVKTQAGSMNTIQGK